MDLLSTVSENCQNIPPPPEKISSDAHKAWLQMVKKRFADKQGDPRPQKPQDVEPSSNEATEGAELHWRWRQLRKGNTTPRDSIKDACPFHREDSRTDAKALQSPGWRPNIGPAPKLQGSSANCSPNAGEISLGEAVSEQVADNRRDWNLIQDKMTYHTNIDESIVSSRRSLGSGLSKSLSAHSFSGSTMASLTAPVHSVRVRRDAATTSRRPRWK
jgi:hypothetical protein